MVISCGKLNYNLVQFGMRNSECVIRNAELMVASLRIYNSACCLDKVVFLGLVDILTTFRTTTQGRPYDINETTDITL